ncbi:MAG: AAA family ATPase, partial [Bdellovibrionales bacterium]|nr:AAA family ATPase [Bdellovibrionales bacterium]
MFLITLLLWGTLQNHAQADTNGLNESGPISEEEIRKHDEIIEEDVQKEREIEEGRKKLRTAIAVVSNKPKTDAQVRALEGREIKELLDGIGRYMNMSDVQVRLAQDEETQKLKDAVKRAFNRKGASGFVITADSGAGKSTALENVGLFLISQGRHVVSLSINSLVAGTKYRGQAEERFQKIIKISEMYPGTVWLIDDLHSAKGAGAVDGSKSDFLDAITPYIAKGTMKVVGATSSDFYHNTFSTDPSLKRVFQEFKLTEPKGEVLYGRLRTWAQSMYGDAVEASITNDFLAELEKLSNYFSSEGVQPSKAVRYLSEILATKPMGPYFTSDIYAAVEVVDGISAESFTPEAKARKLESLKAALDQEVIGQTEAKQALINAAYLALSQMKDKASPQLKILYYGMRGQAKTTIAEMYAKHMELGFHRFMMSSYGPQEIEKLKYEIALEIQKNPFVVLLFDEIEKTPLVVQKALLDFMDKGYFSVNYRVNGDRVVSIGVDTTKASVFYATNAGEQAMADSLATKKSAIGFIAASGAEAKKPTTVQERRSFVLQDGTLSEHLVDRLLPVPVYALSKEHVYELVKVKLQALLKEIKEDRKIDIYLSEEVREG